MNAVDSSVVVAAFSSWHADHAAAAAAVRERPRLISHAALEAYSVLTRLPAPHRAPAALVREFLAAAFREPVLQVEAQDVWGVLGELADHGIAGGATYDGLIALTARAFGANLLTLDRRARPIYERLGVQTRLLGSR